MIVDNGTNAPLASDVRFPAGTDGQQLTALAAQPTGLIYRTITPNAATDNVVPRFDSSGATTPTPLKSSGILISNTGAIQSTPTGGNARGASAIDLQPVRGVATQVASGANSVLAGANSTASGASSIALGNTNVASGANSTAIGTSNTANGINGTALGITSVASNTNATALGHSATASGADSVAIGTLAIASGSFAFAIANDSQATAQYATIIGGTVNSATAIGATVIGGANAIADKYGQMAHSNGAFAVPGDAQISVLMWTVSTTDATVGVEAFLDGAGASQRASIAVGKSWAFQIIAVGRSSAGVDAAWKAEGLIHNNGGTTALVGGAIVPVVIADGTGGTWGVAAGLQVAADNGNDSLKISVTGAVATLIRWVISARLTEVSYP